MGDSYVASGEVYWNPDMNRLELVVSVTLPNEDQPDGNVMVAFQTDSRLSLKTDKMDSARKDDWLNDGLILVTSMKDIEELCRD